MMILQFIKNNRENLLYGMMLAVLLFLLKWLEVRLVIIDHAFEVYMGAIAILFTGLGIWLALKLSRPRIETVIIEKEVILSLNTIKTHSLRLFSKMDVERRTQAIEKAKRLNIIP